MTTIVRPNVERELGIVPELWVCEFRERGVLKHSDPLTYDEALGAVRAYRAMKINSSICRLWHRSADSMLVCSASGLVGGFGE